MTLYKFNLQAPYLLDSLDQRHFKGLADVHTDEELLVEEFVLPVDPVLLQSAWVSVPTSSTRNKNFRNL